MRLRNYLCLICTAALLLSAAPAQNKPSPENDAPKGPGILDIPDVALNDIICFALYTVSDGTLKLTAQLYPIPDHASKTVRLEIMQGNQWVEVARTAVINPGWTAPFRVENWDDPADRRYRVCHGAAAT